VAVRFQLVIDCANPDLLARFWAAAPGYEFPAPPDGFRLLGRLLARCRGAEEELGIGEDRNVSLSTGGNGSTPKSGAGRPRSTTVRVLQQDGLDHYAVAMTDPEGKRVRRQLTPLYQTSLS